MAQGGRLGGDEQEPKLNSEGSSKPKAISHGVSRCDNIAVPYCVKMWP